MKLKEEKKFVHVVVELVLEGGSMHNRWCEG